MSDLLQFEDTALTVIDRDGKKWVRGDQLYGPFGYKSARSIPLVYERNADEFGALETALITVDTGGGPQEVRVFSLRGARHIAMLAKTDRAKRFRAWILDIIERDSADREERLALAESRTREMRGIVLSAKPGWSKIARYWSMGYTINRIAVLVPMPKSRLRRLCTDLVTMGILHPRPDNDGDQIVPAAVPQCRMKLEG